VVKAAEGSPSITMETIQRHLDKWLPRGLEMFGDERGGGTNVQFGLKPMKNREAQEQYYREVEKVVHDLNIRYLRARLPALSGADAEAALERLRAGEAVDGVRGDDLLTVAHPGFFRRRGEPAFRMVGRAGEKFADVEEYLRHLVRTLPDGYRATRDFLDYVEAIREVATGAKTPEEASRRMPSLRRVGGVCPCSRAVRWVADEAAEPPAAGG
jgi:hypothetical protein